MERRTSRALGKEQTRAQILMAARALLREHGAERMTSRALAARAQVAVGTVFLHFPNTTALFEALLDEQLGAALSRAIATVKGRALVPRLCHVARGLFESYELEPSLSRLYLANTLFSSSSSSSSSSESQAGDPRLAEFEAWVGSELTQAAARGAIEPVEPRLGFFLYFSLYFALLVGGLKGQLGREQQLSLLEAGLERAFPRRRRS